MTVLVHSLGTHQSPAQADSREGDLDSLLVEKGQGSIRAWGMGAIAAAIFGKYNLPQGINNQIMAAKDIWVMNK